jgi:L,D-transpeptidase catalytic domain
MRAENPKLPLWVPGGHPMDPPGTRALYLGSSTYRIHGTDAPWTIGSAISKGCVRMYNQDVIDLYPRVRVGASVLVTWDKFDPKADHDGKTSTAADVPEARTPRKTAERATPSGRKVDITTGSLSAPSAGGPETVVAPHSREDHEPPRPVRSRKRVVPPVVKKYVPPEEFTI